MITIIADNNDQKAFDQTIDIVLEFEKICKKFHEDSLIDIGIGIDFSESIEERVDRSPHNDKTLIIGKSLSNSVKICSQVPFYGKETYYIKASHSFIQKIKNKEKIEIKYNFKRNMAFIKSNS